MGADMARHIPPHAFDEVLGLVKHFETGASLDQLLEAAQGALTRRTLQRRLTTLLAEGRIVRHKSWHTSIYRAPPNYVAAEMPLFQIEASAEAYVPMSPQSMAIRDYVRRPIQGRKPVGYAA